MKAMEPEEIAKSICDLVDRIVATGVSKDEVTSAVVGIGLALALEGGIEVSTAHKLVDSIYQEVLRRKREN